MKFLKASAFLILAAVFFVACTKNDKAITTHNGSLTYNGTTYFLDSATAVSSPGNTFVTLSNIGAVKFYSEDTTMPANVVQLGFSRSNLPTGTFTYNENEATFDSTLNFNRAQLALNYNILDQTGITLLVSAGTVNISKDGDLYNIVYELKTADDNTVTGSYQGIPTVYLRQ